MSGASAQPWLVRGKGASTKLSRQVRGRRLAAGAPRPASEGWGGARGRPSRREWGCLTGCPLTAADGAGGRRAGCPPTPAARRLSLASPPGPSSSCLGPTTTGGRGGPRACAGLSGRLRRLPPGLGFLPRGSPGSGAGGPGRAALSLSRPRRCRGCCSGLRLHCRPQLLPSLRSASPAPSGRGRPRLLGLRRRRSAGDMAAQRGGAHGTRWRESPAPPR